jgi:hypothetical protein
MRYALVVASLGFATVARADSVLDDEPMISCPAAGKPIYESHDGVMDGSGKAIDRTITTVYASGAWSRVYVRRGNLRDVYEVNGCLDAQALAAIEELRRVPWKIRSRSSKDKDDDEDEDEKPCMSSGYTTYIVDGRLRGSTHVCDRKRFDDKTGVALGKVYTIMNHAPDKVQIIMQRSR